MTLVPNRWQEEMSDQILACFQREAEYMYFLKFFQKLNDGGKIVNMNKLSSEELEKAKDENRIMIDNNNYVYVYIPD